MLLSYCRRRVVLGAVRDIRIDPATDYITRPPTVTPRMVGATNFFLVSKTDFIDLNQIFEKG
jgi:hypothetical protein